jgi:hypothetical protein
MLFLWGSPFFILLLAVHVFFSVLYLLISPSKGRFYLINYLIVLILGVFSLPYLFIYYLNRKN